MNIGFRQSRSAGRRIRLSLLSIRTATFLLLAIPFLVEVAQAQPGEPRRNDTARRGDEWGEDWTMDSLNLEDFEFDAEEIFHLSRGWFPTPFRAASLSFFGGFLIQDTYDRATGLRTAALMPTTEPFDWHDPYNCSAIGSFFGFSCKEKEILAADSDEPVEDGYPTTSHNQYGLRFLYHLPFPAMLRAEASYRASDGILYSQDTSRAYLSLDGIPRSFREIGVAVHKTEGVSGMVGVQLPVYGAFIDSDFLSLGSYYYLFGGVSADYAIFTRTIQFSQIADAKDQIRYDNGQDTVTLMRNGSGEGFNRLRTAWEAGLGWGLTGEFLVFGIEAFISAPFTSVVTDGEWKQYYGGFRLNFGYQWGTKSSVSGLF